MIKYPINTAITLYPIPATKEKTVPVSSSINIITTNVLTYIKLDKPKRGSGIYISDKTIDTTIVNTANPALFSLTAFEISHTRDHSPTPAGFPIDTTIVAAVEEIQQIIINQISFKRTCSIVDFNLYLNQLKIICNLLCIKLFHRH